MQLPYTHSGPMELHVFGRIVGSRPPTQTHEGSTTPHCTLRAQIIKILWSSWCDAVIAHQNDAGHWTIEYSGMGLEAEQVEQLESSETIKSAVSGSGCKVDFFGTAMHHGLRGFISYGPEYGGNEVVLFSPDTEVGTDVPDIESFALNGDTMIVAIRLTSNGNVLVGISSSQNSNSHIVRLESLAELRRCLRTDVFESATSAIASIDHIQFCTNSTTATVVDKGGQGYTATSDPRYSKCLGRPYGGTANFEPVSYLSETRVDRIASGGYMTAAVSSDHELFLWGQTCPGVKGELSLLRSDYASNNGKAVPTTSGVSAEDEQDECVKCLTVRIDGQVARAYDVTVGHGHILVAAEVRATDGSLTRAVFAAGDNSKRQLGLETESRSLADFEEVSTLRNRKVLQLAAAGWTSYIVTSGD